MIIDWVPGKSYRTGDFEGCTGYTFGRRLESFSGQLSSISIAVYMGHTGHGIASSI